MIRRSNTRLLLAFASLLSACVPRGDSSDAVVDRIAVLPGDSAQIVAPPGAPANVFPAPARPVAEIVAPRWSDEDKRDNAGEAELVLRLLNASEGMHIADIGAGDGYYVARLVGEVGQSGRVYGEDIVPRFLELLAARVRQSGWSNVVVVKGEAHDPRLPEATLDAAILVRMYHEISQPFGLLWNLASAMKPGGRIIVLDLDRPTWSHGTPLSLLRCETSAVGYKEILVDRSVPGEYVAVFEAPLPTERPSTEELFRSMSENPCTFAGGPD